MYFDKKKIRVYILQAKKLGEIYLRISSYMNPTIHKHAIG